MKNLIFVLLIATLSFCCVSCSKAPTDESSGDKQPAVSNTEQPTTSQPTEALWYNPEWIAGAKYNQPIEVLDTDSSLGRYSLQTKTIGIRDIVEYHGHPCDGLVIAYVEIREALRRLFPDGVVDRTDLRVVSKNGPCWVDTATMMTGARINFETLSIDPAIGDGFIVQKISTGEAYDVHLKPGVFPSDQAALENTIRVLRAEGKEVTAEQIDTVQNMADALSRKLLNTPPDEIIDTKPLPDYQYNFQIETGKRGDIINKNAPR